MASKMAANSKDLEWWTSFCNSLTDFGDLCFLCTFFIHGHGFNENTFGNIRSLHHNGISMIRYVCVAHRRRSLWKWRKLKSMDWNSLVLPRRTSVWQIYGRYIYFICSHFSKSETVSSDADEIKNQSSASLAFVRGIHRGPVNSPRKWPVTRKMFPFSDVIMKNVTFRIKCNHLYPVNRLKILSAKMSPFFEGHDMLLQNEFLVYCQMTAYTICTTQFGLYN